MKIIDNSITPFEIHCDSHGCTVYKPSRQEDGQYKLDKNERPVYGAPVGHFSSVGGCLRRIAELKASEGHEASTIGEYVGRLQDVLFEIQSSIDSNLKQS